MPRANPDVNYEISIHALLAESDRSLLLPVRGSRISIHALLAESDHTAPKSRWSTGSFLSTLSLRRATLELKPISNFGLISIHALLAESDLPQSAKVGVGVSFLSTLSLRRATAYTATDTAAVQFLSTLSLRRATYDLHGLKMGYCISIHALLAESDCAAAPCPHGRCYFYPRSPCGERRVRCLRASLRPSFLSTLSLRRATHLQGHGLLTVVISIHALLAESD